MKTRRPRTPGPGARRGVALLMTLLIVGLLSASVLSYMRMTHLEAKMADNTYAFVQAEVLAHAGLKGAMTLLAMDDQSQDSLNDIWANFAQYAALAAGLFDEGTFTGQIEDLSGRFNPNTIIDENGLLVQARLDQFLRLFDLLGYDSAPVPSILDWIDPDDEIRPDGAENQYYQTLADPYPCPNETIRALGQLRLIRGLDTQVLYGTEERPALLQYLTVHSDGQININTAGETVLMSLDDDLTQGVVQEIIDRRTSQPFTKLDELGEISGLSPQAFARITGRLAVSSSHFQIRVEGRFREATVLITAIVSRNKNGVTLIYYRSG